MTAGGGGEARNVDGAERKLEAREKEEGVIGRPNESIGTDPSGCCPRPAGEVRGWFEGGVGRPNESLEASPWGGMVFAEGGDGAYCEEGGWGA